MAPVLFNISTEYKSQSLVCGISALVCGISALVCGISALVCGISALACGISARNDSTVSLVYHPSLLLLLPTCWLHKQNSYQSSSELSRTYQLSAGVITKFSQNLTDNFCEDDKVNNIHQHH